MKCHKHINREDYYNKDGVFIGVILEEILEIEGTYGGCEYITLQHRYFPVEDFQIIDDYIEQLSADIAPFN